MALLTMIGGLRRPWYVSAHPDETVSRVEHLLATDDVRDVSDLAGADNISLSRYTSQAEARDPVRADSIAIAFWTVQADDSLLISLPTGPAILRPPGERALVKVSVGGAFTRSAQAWTDPTSRFPDLPVDVVYAWVDGDDPAWRRRRAATMARAGDRSEPWHASALDASRFRSRDELRYSMRSVNAYAPWVRHIWLVTDQQVPTWLDTAVPGLTVVDHRELFSEHELPVFNSRAIETRLHTIEGLTEHYLYFNDDMLLGRQVEKQDFFASATVSKFFASKVTLTPRASRADATALEGGRLLSQELIARRFGVAPLNVFRHTPYPQQRSLMYELEEMFREHFTRTASSPFRSGDDIVPGNWMHFYGGYFLGRTSPSHIDYDYFQTDHLASRPEALAELAACRKQVYCINDYSTDSESDDLAAAALHRTLEALLPHPSPYETVPAW
jgi:hypothetical protein